MDNENMNFQGNENENNITPEEKVKEDIGSRIADAAAEIRDEINGIEYIGSTEDIDGESAADGSWNDENWDNSPLEAKKPEPARMSIAKSAFVMSLIGAAIVGALMLFFGMKVPAIIDARPEGSTVATVNGENITDLDVNYYIYSQVAEYANQNNLSQSDITDYDWDQEIDGKKLSDTIKEKAINDAINEVLLIQKGAANGIELDDSEKSQIDTQLSGILSSYGEEGFALRARTMAIASTKQYKKMYNKVMVVQKVQDDIEENTDEYYPEDISVLKDYTQSDKASVKHILIKTSDEEGASAEDKLAIAQSVLERAKSGEDFNALMDEFNEDTGEPAEGYTFGSGEMEFAFETAAFGLSIDEISDIVETSYGYHIIKRVPGLYELQGYWQAQAGNKIKKNSAKIAKLSVADVMADVQAATDELQAQSSSSSSAR